MTNLKTLTDKIQHDILNGNNFFPYSEETPRSVRQAYAIQDELTLRLVDSKMRGPVAGWKIAANSAQLLERFKLTEPATGRIFANQCYVGEAVLKAADYIEFAFEPEIVAIMGATINPDHAPFSASQIKSAIDKFYPGIELLDMRNTDALNTHMPDVIAQNISNVGAVIGGPGVSPDSLKTEEVRTVVRIDDQVVHDATGTAPQDPIEAVTWLANHLASRGFALEKGQVVFCGTHSPIRKHKGTGKVEVNMSGIGIAALSLG